jgi:hypothetical protein
MRIRVLLLRTGQRACEHLAPAGLLADGLSFAIEQLRDKGTLMGGYVIF